MIDRGSDTGKSVVITGSTGGLGQELCRALCRRGASLILVNRNPQKAARQKQELQRLYPNSSVELVTADLSSPSSVRAACRILKEKPVDVLIHNAGVYDLPKHIGESGYDDVFTVDFLSPFSITTALTPLLEQRKGRVIVVGSIAYRYRKSRPDDPDFSYTNFCNFVYGNAKRYLMASHREWAAQHPSVLFAMTHPGISFTGITNHYPKWLFAIIRRPMKILFMKPAKAMKSILNGMEQTTGYSQWIGPRILDVWGKPAVRMARIPVAESHRIYQFACQAVAEMNQKEEGSAKG